MNVALLLQMAADGLGSRVALGARPGGIGFDELLARAQRAATVFEQGPGGRVVLVDLNSEAVPIALFGAAVAGQAFVPVNYRLADDQLRATRARSW